MIGQRSQKGAALVVVMLLLIVVTLLGLAAMRGAIMQERMAASTLARAVAFQAAESGLRQGEMDVRDQVMAPGRDLTSCSAGLCGMPKNGAKAQWDVAGFWKDGATGYKTGNPVGDSGYKIVPRYVVENYGTVPFVGTGGGPVDCSKQDCETAGKPGAQTVYRITSRAATENGAEVLLQSLYIR